MGAIPLKETHVQRSSSKSFQWRWKHDNLRLIVLSITISLAMTFMFLVLLKGTSEKSVSLVLNGQEKIISTSHSSLQQLLEEQAIAVGPYDELSIPLGAALQEGDRIVIDQAVPVTILADGKTLQVNTTKKTVEAAIGESNIAVREQDKVFPSSESKLKANMTIRVMRIDKQQVKTTHDIPFTVVRKQDATLEKGQLKMVKAGQNGQLVKTFEKVYQDGKLVTQTLLAKSMEKPAVSKIVAVGTKEKPKPKPAVLTAASSSPTTALTKSGLNLKAKKVLTNVTLTAYTAGFASTGKSKGDPGYGITASGAKVSEGRTIAVDPDVIPMGWWVYIEGIGFRRAEDTGGAINGKKIDVFYESESYVKKFGKKRGYTVYVLGPTKPKLS
ncbi:3D domain-containing protein [Paenibacillus sp. B01]|uniref:3D domain-containing protein n=1 Tax=Paenibacillus sp. B01 TaxID=2660554 RepID=UPI001E33BD2F|nr:3D domain-containing protein [Paenibacillus sp. B01]